MKKNFDNMAPSILSQLSGDMVSTMMAWVEAMQGRRGIDDALQSISDLAGSEAIGLHKFDHENGEAAKTITVHSRSAGKVFSSRGWKSLAPAEVLKRAVDGSLWTKAELFDAEFTDLAEQTRTEPKIKEVAIIPLQNNFEELCVMEMQFYIYPTQPRMDALAFLAGHFSLSWQRRLPGVDVVPSLKAVEKDSDERSSPKNILTHQNPCDLSKTEFRICMLLSKGASIKAIAATSGIRERTVHTHLSSIYAKVGVEGQLQLLHHLMGGDAQVA